MDSSEGFCFEVPIIKVEKIEDIHKINATKSSDKKYVANANDTSNPTTAVEKNKSMVSNFASSDECILIEDQNHYSYSTLCSETETAAKSTNVPISSTTNEDTSVDEGTNEQRTKKSKTLDQTSNLLEKCPAESSPAVIDVDKHKKCLNKDHPNRVPADISNQTKDHTERHVDGSISIIIDEDADKDNDCTIIENDINKSQSHFKDVHCFHEIYKANRLLSDIIEKCLNMENSAGMLRVINRTLIPMFIGADEIYKKSFPFQKCLSLTIKNIDREPEKKFSHIRNLCQCLKLNKAKKRVSFKTLDNKLNGRFSKHSNQFSPEEIPTKRKKFDTIIDLDTENDEVLIDCSNDTDLQIQITDVRGHVTEEDSTPAHKVNSNKTNFEVNGNDNKLSNASRVPNKKQDDDVILVDNEDNCDKENDNVVQTVNKELLSNNVVNNEIMAIDLSNEPDDIDTNIVSNPRVMPKPLIHKEKGGSSKEQIKSLEEEIAYYNKAILELEEQEVTSDEEWNSPYILSERYKAKVVCLYKQLCTLTGTESVKRHRVRLKVDDGHPEGPVRCLEEYINNNIDKDGNPPFPDMHDVINCVNRANELHNMGWSKSQVEREARALFIQYGRTMQKRRMKREWQHLMTYVKVEVPDPADDDPKLQAQLLENTKIAKKNEDELLERYAQMENMSSIPNPDLTLSLDFDSGDSNDDSNDNANSHLPSYSNVQNEPILESNPNSNILRLNSYEQGSQGNVTNNVLIFPVTIPVQYGVTPYVIGYVSPVSQPTGMVMSTDVALTIGQTEITMNHQNTLGNSETISELNSQLSNKTATPAIVVNYMTTNLDTSKNKNNTETENCEVTSTSEGCESNINHVELNVEKNAENSKLLLDNNTCELESGESAKSQAEAHNVTQINESLNDKACEHENTDAETPQKEETNKLVKREPLDIPRMLEELGDDFTATILDIEDPFLVIEISDSSCSEDEES